VERLSLVWKTIFPKQVRFHPNRFLKSTTKQTVTVEHNPDQIADSCETWLSRQAGPVIRQKDQNTTLLYAEKGRWTRLGVFVVHASVLLLLAGALVGAMFGFKASVRIEEGGQARQVFAAKTREPIPLEFIIKCNEFEVKFYDTGAPEEFRSNLTIIENGQESLTTDIRVNHPLRYKGINIFQSSYGTANPGAAVLAIMDNQTGEEITRSIQVGETITLPHEQGSFLLQGFLPHFDFRGHNLEETFFGKVNLAGEPEIQIGLPVKFPTFDKMRKGRFTFVIKDFEKRYYTGLQVTKDPGVWYVYAGFIMMILGCWITFFMSHQSYLVAVEPMAEGGTCIHLAGRTNRSSQEMKRKLARMKTHLENQLKKV
jgi:cytochrome c biogenesis protein